MDVFPVELQEAAKLEQNRNRSNQELDEMNPFQVKNITFFKNRFFQLIIFL